LLTPTGVAVLPMDRPEGIALRARLHVGQPVLGVSSTPHAPSAGTHSAADVAVETCTMTGAGLRARLRTPIGPLEISSSLVGAYNLANLTLAVGMAIGHGGIDREHIVRGIQNLAGVPGRLEIVPSPSGILTVVDYAHTPDALERAMAALRPLVGPGGRLVTVFGCGGDRDRGKRPIMGRAAARDSDLVIITSDNPRGEDPQSIIDAIVEGAASDGDGAALMPAIATSDLALARRGRCVEPDRRRAIQAAVGCVCAGDVLLIAGKGHEDYQIVGTERLHFDDREEAAMAFAQLTSPATPKPPTETR